jgi:hypothetical protein
VRALLDDYRQFSSSTAAATTTDSADSSNRYGTATAASAFATDTGTKTASNSVEYTARSTPTARRRTTTPHNARTPYSERITALTRATSSFNLDDAPDDAAVADMCEARDSSNTTPPPASLLGAHAQPRTAVRRVSTDDDDTHFSPFAVRHSAALASLRNRSAMSPLRQPGTAAAATTANYTSVSAATTDAVTADDSTSASADTMASLTNGVHGLLHTPLRSAMQVASSYCAHTAPAAAAGGTTGAAGTGTGTSTAARRISFDIDSSDEANAGNDIDTEQQQLERTGSFLWELALSESKFV